MNRIATPWKLFASVAFAVCAALIVAWPRAAVAQTTVTADWTNLGNSNLQEVPDGTTLSVATNTVTIDTVVVTDGDANDGNFTNFYSTGNLSYYTGQVSSFTGVLLYSMDHTVFDAGDYFQSTYSFDNVVTDLTFTVGNVDRFFGGVNFHDAVVIEYDTGDGVWRNLRSLSGAVTLGSAVSTTTINGQQGWDGNAYSGGITSTTGDIRVDIGSTSVERVRIRYLFGQDSPGSNPSGNWQYLGLSDFSWTEAGLDVADLSLTKSVNNSNPAQGSTISYTLNLSSASGSDTSNSVQVLDILPAGFAFQSASGFGSYNSSTGIWSVPSIAAGQTRSIAITGTVSAPAGVTITNSAEVFDTETYDNDSTPNNSSNTEDDDAQVSFTVQGTRTAGTPPPLSCPAGTNVFDWDTRTWTAGSLNNTYTVTNFGDVNFAITAEGTWANDPAFGGQQPALSTANSGGLATSENSLHQFLDFDDRFQTATTLITLPNGIAGAQFTIFDIDFAANDFADRVTVTGSYKGSTVIPTLTNGVVNYVVGNTAIGDGTSANGSSAGNVVVTFSQPIDEITIVYGNANTAPANPDGQAIAIHDFNFCAPTTSLSVTKISSIISDPVNGGTDAKAIPGALIEYLITVSNNGISDADAIIITDDNPAEAKMCLIDAVTGPVTFNAGSSGLNYNYDDTDPTNDDLEFSSDNGTTFALQPTADADGCNGLITDFRVTPSGSMVAGSTVTLTIRYRIL